MNEYSDLTCLIPTEDLLRRFHVPSVTYAACKECGCFGTQWSCPPLAGNIAAELKHYSHVLIIATRIPLGSDSFPLSEYEAITDAHRLRLQKILLGMESQTGGYASLTIGRCNHCGKKVCTRTEGKPCRHPDLVRPSLEACGFDITAILRELFGIDLEWGKSPELLPATLTLVTALFHDSKDSAC